jgi:hypothetical protein
VKNLKRFTGQEGRGVSNNVVHEVVSNKKGVQTKEDALAELLEQLEQVDLDSPLEL